MRLLKIPRVQQITYESTHELSNTATNKRFYTTGT